MPTRTELLRRWYEPRRRAYPWRRRPTAYRVLVSEIMLQQTQAPRVEPYFLAFVKRFPSVAALARARRSDVLAAWSGLGYNRRAAALHEAARVVVADHGGRIPCEVDALLTLPGVGPYTAAAVASIAFGEPVPLVDTNVRRVLARCALGLDAADAEERAIQRLARRWLDRERPGDHNQTLMDLGREVCRPTSPRCGDCPLARSCRFRRSGGVTKPLARRQSTFEGSLRQVRGAVLRELTAQAGATGLTVGTLARRTGYAPARIGESLAALSGDGLVHAGPAAQDGRPSGRVQIAEPSRPMSLRPPGT